MKPRMMICPHQKPPEIEQVIHSGISGLTKCRTYEDVKGSNTIAVMTNMQLRHRLRELDFHVLLIRQEESECYLVAGMGDAAST